MRHGIRYSSFLLVSALFLCLGASSSAQQVRFEDFSNTNFANKVLYQNYSYKNGNGPYLTTYQGNSVLRLTDGAPAGTEASTVYFNIEQPLTSGFTTYFEFQMHNPIRCCNPGDGIAFILQYSNATDGTMGATGSGLSALGAGGNTSYSNQAGAMGYAGINNSLVVEFDVHQDDWDPTPNHIAVQTCGPPTENNQNYNTPVHDSGTYQIGNNSNVTSCLYMNGIDSQVPQIGGKCNPPQVCQDGKIHKVAMQYLPPGKNGSGVLQIWLDPTFIPGTHKPEGPPTLTVPLTIEDELNLDSSPNCLPSGSQCAWVGFTASQPEQSTAQDILAWEFTPFVPTIVQQTIQPGGTPTVFGFGVHQTTVTYPVGFSNPNGILMSVLATPTDRKQFYQTRLLGTPFANEQCIVYLGTGGGGGDLNIPNTSCIVYSYSCQDSMGNQVNCPTEQMCTPPSGNQCIVINTTFDTSDNVTPTNADYLENDAAGDNNWMSIFTKFMSAPIDGTTSGGSRGFGGSGSKPFPPARSKFFTPQAETADIVATFRPGQP